MTICAIKGCSNKSEYNKKDTKITFHLFPSDPIVANRWIEKVRLNRKESWWKPTKFTKICSNHFEDKLKYTTKRGLIKLCKGAVPTKDLHIFCTDSPNNNFTSNDDQHDIHVSNQTHLVTVENRPSTSGEKKIIKYNEFEEHALMNFISDHDLDSPFDTPRKAFLRSCLRRKIFLQQKHSRKIKTLLQQNRRIKKQNLSLQQILKELRKERYIDIDLSNMLSVNVFAAELFNNLVKKTKNKKRPMPKYTPAFRKFCLTLHFYSPRAYTYVRKTFDACLPHPKTIYNWYRNVNGSPGLTDEAFKLLESKAQLSDKKLICTLIADEMAIRPQNFKGGHGRVDLGIGTSDCTITATQAYTLILVCLNEHWKIPLGYFLVHTLTAVQKVNVIKMCLTKCEQVGVKVVALTFDAHSTNISAMELLGCQIKNPAKMKTSFKHPAANHEVAVFLDSNHMIKLVRNHFEDKKEFLDQHKRKVDWNFLIKLNNLQEKEGLHIANKLTRKHLEFRNSIMKVKLASQLLSRSVAVALRFCREVLKLETFKDSDGTEEFIMIFNNLFDIFNSRRLTQHGFCHPFSKGNKIEILDFLQKAKEYILNLQIKTTRRRKFNENNRITKLKIKSFQPVVTVKCSPGFRGLLVCIESLVELYKTLVEDTEELNYISTYRISQDHIELLFGSIRMHGGHNDNPNALQFKGSYRKLLCRMELQVGETGNCVPLENISVLTCSSALTCINATSLAERFDDADVELSNLIQIPQDDASDLEMSHNDDPDFKNHIVGYIAGNVVRYISRRIKCGFCIDSMFATEKMWYHKLVCMRDNGGLVYASKEVYDICVVSEKIFRLYIKINENNYNYSEKALSLKVMAKLIDSGPLFPSTENHINYKYHVTNLARLIVERYLKIRLYYESKKDNLSRLLFSKRQFFRKQLQLQGF